MVVFKEFVKVTFVSVTLLIGITSAATSQEQVEESSAENVITETFDGDDLSLILGGQLAQRSGASEWLLYVADGKLVMENRKNSNSLHYNDITWVKFPESDTVTTTDNAVISAIVEAENEGNGGVGILVGSGKAGAYLMFSVDAQGRYHLLKKDGRTLRPVHSAIHEAIAVDAPNELTFEVRGTNAAFFANGTEIIKIPYMDRFGNARQNNERAGVGVAAFGIGRFFFESVEIAEAD